MLNNNKSPKVSFERCVLLLVLMILTCEKTRSTFALDAGKENRRLAKIRALDHSLAFGA